TLTLTLTLLTLIASSTTLGGCGDLDEGLRFSGETGVPQTLLFAGDTPLVDARVTFLPGGSAPLPGSAQPLLLDTGAPITLLSSHAFPKQKSGWLRADLDLLGLHIPDRTVGLAPLFDASPCSPAPAGVLGGDVLAHFRVNLNYDTRQIILDGPPLSGETLPLDVAGGGRLQLSPQDLVGGAVGPTRLLVAVEVEGQAALALIDTGASMTVLSEHLLATLGVQDRPRACCQRFATQTGPVDAALYRLSSLRLASITLANVTATVLPDASLFSPLAAEIGRPVDLLLGGSALRALIVDLDAPAKTLRVKRNAARHVDDEEWILPGFSICRGAEGKVFVVDVYEDTDAKTRGVRGGEELIAVSDRSVNTMGKTELASALRAPGIGAKVRLRFATGGGTTTVDREVKVEDVLPHYP
ncbi:MAG: aspartyl protease family protein, partial [Deltaproteobacteria bacterium]|nr:aspartyl protease family protein [Deltaproteobacteria bacterium]